MENLLDYLLYALFGNEVIDVRSGDRSSLLGKSWTIVFEGAVYIVLDEIDLQVIHELYNKREDHLKEDERARFMRIFELCK